MLPIIESTKNWLPTYVPRLSQVLRRARVRHDACCTLSQNPLRVAGSSTSSSHDLRVANFHFKNRSSSFSRMKQVRAAFVAWLPCAVPNFHTPPKTCYKITKIGVLKYTFSFPWILFNNFTFNFAFVYKWDILPFSNLFCWAWLSTFVSRSAMFSADGM